MTPTYSHSHDHSAELLRKALPLMSRQAAALTPTAYAVWYAYVADPSGALRRDVDREIARRGTLDDGVTRALHDLHLVRGAAPAPAPTAKAGAAVPAPMPAPAPSAASAAPAAAAERAARLAERLGELVESLGTQAALASGQAGDYGRTLERLSAELAPGGDAAPGDPGDVLRELIMHTQQMRTQMSTLESRLSDSQREVARLHDEVEQARHESLVDPLTGLANRRAFERRLGECLAAGAAPGAGPGLILIDLDHFKRINDTYGHPFGDQVLRAMAQLLRQHAPAPLLPARIGGEEFAVLLPAADTAALAALAERLRVTAASSRIRRKGEQEAIERVTISLGATLRRDGDGTESIVDRADRALYASKAGGRDRVTLDA